MERLLGGSLAHLEQGMRYRSTRQAALASNVANADTPGYRRVDVRFEDALAKAAGEIRSTAPNHLSGTSTDGMRLVTEPAPRGGDRNGVERDLEVVRLSRNAGAFEDQAQILARLFTIRRMAATGEL